MEIKNFIKKIWTELTRVRVVEFKFKSLETQEEENLRLAKEFFNKKVEISRKNYCKIMNEILIPKCREELLKEYGYMPSDMKCFEAAHIIFIEAKKIGKIDALNQIVD